jgi:hypothetical protein
MSNEIALIYIGNGSFKPNVPARDLTAEDLKDLPMSREELIKSGLYKEPDTAGKRKELSQKDKE